MLKSSVYFALILIDFDLGLTEKHKNQLIWDHLLIPYTLTLRYLRSLIEDGRTDGLTSQFIYKVLTDMIEKMWVKV